MLFKRKDLLIIGVLLVASLGVLGYYSLRKPDGGIQADIYHFDKKLATIDLSHATEREYIYDDVPNVVIATTADGRIFFKHSDCPDKVCINSGKLKLSGQSAACLPNGVMVKLTSQNYDDDPEIIIR